MEEEEEKRTKKKTEKYRERKWWEKCREVHHKFFYDEGGEKQRGEGKQTKDKTLQSKANVEEILLLLILGQNGLSVSTAFEGSQSSTEAVTRMQ